jgi:hypothetical protein
MFLKLKKINLIFILLCFQTSFSQVNVPKKDSLEMYKDIQAYSKKHKFTNFFHKLIFIPIKKGVKHRELETQTNYKEFECKIIRSISVETLDPFGYSVVDTTRKPSKWLEKSGNRLHIKTKKLAIKNLLLIKKNMPFDSLLVRESARLIRSQNYVSRVSIEVKSIGKGIDSVDVFIRTLDTWSMLPNVSFSGNQSNFRLKERNFFGSGHTLNAEYLNRFSDGEKGNKLEYIIPNIKNTFIQTRFNYSKDLDHNIVKSIAIERPFYSSFAKWAGGINLGTQAVKDTLPDINGLYAKQNFNYNFQDLWTARSFKLFNGNEGNDRFLNLIVSGRYLNIKYTESPVYEYDPIRFYSSEHFFLSGIGLSMRRFVVDKYIFKNGVPEDVPYGEVIGITGGYQFKNNVGRLYLGSQITLGKYFEWGFLSTNFEAGTFFENSKTSQTAISFQANYFTNLFHVGKWKLRQFVKPQLIYGKDRQNSIGDQITINDTYGIQGFDSAVFATKKMLLTLQTQSYSPFNFLGFRFNPYFNYTLALLGNKINLLGESKTFSKIGIGFIITNDYLVFRSFQISLAYYPRIPGNGNNVFKTNSFETTDFGFQDFNLDKPRTVIYK